MSSQEPLSQNNTSKMLSIPTRLIANEEKVNLIRDNQCNNCYLFRRTDLKYFETPSGEIGADVWPSRDIFGMSLNIHLCNTNALGIESFKDDVNTVLLKVDNTKFYSDEQLKNYNLDKIEVFKKDTLIIFMKIEEILSIKGTYPFKKGTPEEISYSYELRGIYDPLVLNTYHYLIEVFSDETGSWDKISRTNKKNYIRSLSTEIRNKILNEKKVFLLK